MSKYHDFRIGDKVKIVKRIEKGCLESRWNANGKMDWTLGKIGEIIEIFDNYILKVRFVNDEIWNYHHECLQKVKEDPFTFGLNEAVFKIPHFDINGFIARSWNKNLKEDKMGNINFLNLYSVYVVNKNTEEILVDKRTVIGSDKTEIECSVRDELIRKDKDLKSSDLIFEIEIITSWEVEIEK